MQKINGTYHLSAADREEIEAHARKIARKAAYTGSVEAWFDSSTGNVQYCEIVGIGGMESSAPYMELVCTAYCRG